MGRRRTAGGILWLDGRADAGETAGRGRARLRGVRERRAAAGGLGLPARRQRARLRPAPREGRAAGLLALDVDLPRRRRHLPAERLRRRRLRARRAPRGRERARAPARRLVVLGRLRRRDPVPDRVADLPRVGLVCLRAVLLVRDVVRGLLEVELRLRALLLRAVRRVLVGELGGVEVLL